MGGLHDSVLSVWERENTQNSDRYCKQQRTKKKLEKEMQDFFFTVSLYIVYQCSSEEKKTMEN